MGKYQQTAARIGFGLAAIGTLAVLLWPQSFDEFLELERVERLFFFGTALIVWIFSELKLSEEVLFRTSSENDIRVARLILDHHSEHFRVLLRDHDFHSSIDPRYVSEANYVINEYANHRLNFQKNRLKERCNHSLVPLRSFRGL